MNSRQCICIVQIPLCGNVTPRSVKIPACTSYYIKQTFQCCAHASHSTEVHLSLCIFHEWHIDTCSEHFLLIIYFGILQESCNSCILIVAILSSNTSMKCSPNLLHICPPSKGHNNWEWGCSNFLLWYKEKIYDWYLWLISHQLSKATEHPLPQLDDCNCVNMRYVEQKHCPVS